MSQSIAVLLSGTDARSHDILYGTAIFAAITVVLATIFFFRFARGLTEWLQAGRLLRRQFPSPPVDSLLLGHTPSMQHPQQHRWLDCMAKQHGRVFYIRLANNHVVMITDPALLPTMFDRQFYPPNADALDRPIDGLLHRLDDVLSDSRQPCLLTAKTGDPLWRLVRKGIAPAFNPQNIRQGFVHVVDAASQLIEQLRARGPDREVDIDNAAQRVTLEVIGRVGFGKAFGSLSSLDEDSGVFKLVALALAEASLRIPNPLRQYMIFNPDLWRASADVKKFTAITRELLEEVKARGPPAEDDPTIAGHLLRLRDASGQPLSDARLHSEVSVMFVAGMDTTGHTIANTLFLISQHPEVEARVTAELDALGLLVTPQRASPTALDFAGLSKLTYLSAAIKESMRMMSVVGAGVGRVAHKQLQLGPYTIPRNTILWAPIQALHSSPVLWDQPDKFMPERWLTEENAEYWAPPAPAAAAAAAAATNGLHAATNDCLNSRTTEAAAQPKQQQQQQQYKRFLPFGEGMRNCVGQSLAKMNYTAVTALLLSHFTFRLADRMGGAEGVFAAEHARITVSPHNGLYMHAIPRPA